MIDRELIDACTHCGFCLPTCPTYGPLGQMEADSPRGRIWLMRGLVDGTMTVNESVVEHIDRCLGCMACVTACPSGVRYDLLIEQTREVVEEEYDRPAGDWLLRTLVFSVFPYRRRLRVALALSPLASVLPGKLRALGDLAPPWPRGGTVPAGTVPAVRERRGRVGLLTGCVQSVVFGDVNTATARVLSAEGFEVVTPADQACCGALHLHAGRREEGRRRAKAIGERFRAAGVDTIAVNAAGCGSHLKEAGLDVRVADLSELLAETEPRAKRHPLDIRVAFQDSCHLSHAQGIRVDPRELLDAIPGLERLEPAEQAICCGSAGIYNVERPEVAAELGERKARNLLATGAEMIASGNIGCLTQLGNHLAALGHPIPALHTVQVLDRAYSRTL